MTIKLLLKILSLCLFGLIITACGSSADTVDDVSSDGVGDMAEADAEHHEDDDSDHQDNDDEHHEEDMGHEHLETPHEFEDLTNPLADNPAAISAGKVIFNEKCATCHGPEGKGDGPAAAALDPKPASLADAEMMQDMSDGYIYWRVSEGGMTAPFNSVMPAWKDLLSEEDIWQSISYVRSLSE